MDRSRAEAITQYDDLLRIARAAVELDQLEAMAARDADVRTLDVDSTPKRYWRTTPALKCWECCLMVWVDSRWRSAEELFEGATPDEARAKAAAWVRDQCK